MKLHIITVFLLITNLSFAQKIDTTFQDPAIDSLLNLGQEYFQNEDYERAGLFYKEAKQLTSDKYGDHSRLMSKTLDKLSWLYYYSGEVALAEESRLRELEITKLLFGTESKHYLTSLGNLAAVYQVKGDQVKSEKCFLECLDLIKKLDLTDGRMYIIILNNLGIFYRNIGVHDEAEKLLSEGYERCKIKYESENPLYISLATNLAVLYDYANKDDLAEPLFLEVMDITKKVYGADHTRYANIMASLANLYYKTNRKEKAEPLYLESHSIRVKRQGKDHIDVAVSLFNMGNFYMDIDELDKAESMHLESMRIRKKSLGTDHHLYAESIRQLASNYWFKGDLIQSELFFSEYSSLIRNWVLKGQQYLSESELRQYMAKFKTTQDMLLSFTNENQLSGSLNGICYDNALLYKGFLMNGVQTIRRMALSDDMIQEKYQHLQSIGNTLASQYSILPDLRDSLQIASLEKERNTIEKEMTSINANFGNAIKEYNWKDVRDNLKNNEAAIEFMKYDLYSLVRRPGYEYAALIIRPDDEYPMMVPLFEERSLDSLLLMNAQRRSDYVNDLYSVSDRGATALARPNKSLYEIIWQPMAHYLKDTKTIYYAPTGLMHRINMGAISVNIDTTIGDLFELNLVNSTKSVVELTMPMQGDLDIDLFGGIHYDIDESELFDIPYNENENLMASRGLMTYSEIDTTLRGGEWDYLEWTKREVEAISNLGMDKQVNITMHQADQATEALFKDLGRGHKSPEVIHVATHGFFFPDGENHYQQNNSTAFEISQNPMLRSGLIMSHGNHVWSGKAALPTKEDGILTAYEISNLDLSNTKLVVMSACETGLGDIEGSEGVYGLQRAFKIAGVEYIIMSLWQVPDRQTKDFMVSFYRHWLEGDMDIPSAFRTTQQEMKDRFYDPFLWAGFVLLN